MTGQDPELKRLKRRLSTLESRRRRMERLIQNNGTLRSKTLKAIDGNIASTKREIRKREYVLSQPKPKR